jgi:bifunctional non-homologous end joining protein LigD
VTPTARRTSSCYTARLTATAPSSTPATCWNWAGVDLRVEPLEERRGSSSISCRRSSTPGVRYNEHIEGDGATIFAHACKLGFEGIVSKHRKHPYRSGPSKSWIKVKNPKAPGVLRFKEENPAL